MLLDPGHCGLLLGCLSCALAPHSTRSLCGKPGVTASHKQPSLCPQSPTWPPASSGTILCVDLSSQVTPLMVLNCHL